MEVRIKKVTAAAPESERVGIDRNPAAWAGFSLKHGNDLIGIGKSDIFYDG